MIESCNLNVRSLIAVVAIFTAGGLAGCSDDAATSEQTTGGQAAGEQSSSTQSSATQTSTRSEAVSASNLSTEVTPMQMASNASADSTASAATPVVVEPVARWYTPAQVSSGAKVFATNCASCHGASAQGNFNWRKQGPDGRFPPPPLDGTGHAWHHPLSVLVAQVTNGASGGRGAMPPFGGTLSEQQILDALAWTHSRWSEQIYTEWAANGGPSR